MSFEFVGTDTELVQGGPTWSMFPVAVHATRIYELPSHLTKLIPPVHGQVERESSSCYELTIDCELTDFHDAGNGTVSAFVLTIPGGDRWWGYLFNSDSIVSSANAPTDYRALGDAIAACMAIVEEMPVPVQ